MTAPNPAIAMRDAVVVLGDYPVLSGATMRVAPGDIVLLEGPNGAGKSSILRLCAGLLSLRSGALEVLGVDVGAQPDAILGDIGYLGHDNGLYGELTCAENVNFYARVTGGGLSAKEALDVMGLSSRVANTRADRLSAGQRRRTAFAVLLLSGAKLWLLDEPHAGLDATSRDIIDNAIHQSQQTVVFASHERDRAHNLATRVLFVRGGFIDGENKPSVVTHA